MFIIAWKMELTWRCCFPEHFESLTIIFWIGKTKVMQFLNSPYFLPFLFLLNPANLFWSINYTDGTNR